MSLKLKSHDFESLCLKFLFTADKGLSKLAVPVLVNPRHSNSYKKTKSKNRNRLSPHAVPRVLDKRAVRIFKLADADGDLLLNVREACALQNKLGRTFGPDDYSHFCKLYSCETKAGIDVVAFDKSYGEDDTSREHLLSADFAQLFGKGYVAGNGHEHLQQTESSILRVGSEVEALLVDSHRWYPALVLKVMDVQGNDLPSKGDASQLRCLLHTVDLEFHDGRVLNNVHRSRVRACSTAKWFFRRALANSIRNAAMASSSSYRPADDRLKYAQVTRLCRITGNRPISQRDFHTLCSLLGCTEKQGLGLSEYERAFRVGKLSRPNQYSQSNNDKIEKTGYNDGRNEEQENHLWLIARRLVPRGSLVSAAGGSHVPSSISPSRRHLRNTTHGQRVSNTSIGPFVSSLRGYNGPGQKMMPGKGKSMQWVKRKSGGAAVKSTLAWSRGSRRMSDKSLTSVPLRKGLKVQVQIYQGGPWVSGHVATAARVDGKFNIRLDNEDATDLLRGIPRNRVRIHPSIVKREASHFRPLLEHNTADVSMTTSRNISSTQPLGGAFASMTAPPQPYSMQTSDFANDSDSLAATKLFRLPGRSAAILKMDHNGNKSLEKKSMGVASSDIKHSVNNNNEDTKQNINMIRAKKRVYVQLYPCGPWVLGTVTAARRDGKFNVKLDFEGQKLRGVPVTELRVVKRFAEGSSKSRNFEQNNDGDQTVHGNNDDQTVGTRDTDLSWDEATLDDEVPDELDVRILTLMLTLMS